MPTQTEESPRNIVALAQGGWAARGPETVFRWHDDDLQWHDVSGDEAMDMVRRAALGLIAQGVKVGDRVAIMARTRYEWTIIDLALWSVGAIPVPIYDSSSQDQIDWITSDADVSRIFVETAHHAELARAVATQTESPLQQVYVIDEGALEDLFKAGVGGDVAEVERRTAAVGLDDLATIIYTSGTTGRPKGVRLNHFHFVHHTKGIQEALPEVLYQEGASTVLFMTLAHVFARLIEIVFIATGVVVGFCPDSSKLVPLLGPFKPTLLVAVPRVFEKVYNGAEQKAAAGGKVKIFRWAAQQSIDYSMALDTPGGPGMGLKLRHALAHKLVLSKIMDLLGGQARWAVSGSAPLGARLGHFYRGLGITVLEGYGLTETTAASHVNRPTLSKIGSVGLPLSGTEVKIADDGEVLMRGPIVFDGYHHNPEATAAAFEDGWFKSGDVGYEDEDGYLFLTGRKKEIIVTAGGKNVAPAVLEDRLRAYALVSQVVVVGDARPFIGALITLDEEALPGWLKSHGLPVLTLAEAVKDPTILGHLDKAVERANKAVSRAESIRKYELLTDDFTIANGYLTPSLKVKRSLVLRDYANVIEELYTDNRSGAGGTAPGHNVGS
ncbi:AMP-dependent synthetase/ligase [Demequina sp.]|uniref:AMP-dependent synthetase/ligase n=1 Tax=Demequina sp. TaxID=2050685 RepID=UPI003D0CF4AE